MLEKIIEAGRSKPPVYESSRLNPSHVAASSKKKEMVKGFDMDQAPEKLGLTGNLILATASMPYKAAFERGGEWELEKRRGNSALYESFIYLASNTNWKTTLVCWPGDIQYSTKTANAQQDHIDAHGSAGSAPISVVTAEHYEDHAAEQDGAVVVSKVNRDALAKKLATGDLCGGAKIVPVWMAGEEDGDLESGDVTLKDQSRWTMYAQRSIWPIFHYLQTEPTDGRAEKKWWKDYVEFNKAYADKIISLYQPGDVVWVHDYHLLLLPTMLRQKLPKVYVAMFLHAPFPSSEFYRGMTSEYTHLVSDLFVNCTPAIVDRLLFIENPVLRGWIECLPDAHAERKDLLEGMLGANMIGFQSYAYTRHFISSCTRVCGFESNDQGVNAFGAHVSVDAFPIGINAAKVEEEAFSEEVSTKIALIKELSAGKKVIVGRDRLDSVRGVLQKIQAFGSFLDDFPEWRDKVVLIQVTSPSSSEGPKLEHQVADAIANINGMYGSVEFTPIQHFSQYISQAEYYALLRVADLGLITSVRDGMNTTSLEYVVCQKDNHSPVILSEFTGTAGSLTEAIQVNPWDFKGVAIEIDRCLRMSDAEKQTLSEKLYAHVTENTIQNWSSNFLKQLVLNLANHDQSQSTPPLDRDALLAQYNKAKRRLFMFDYDGTLTPIVSNPAAALPTDRLRRTLKTLSADPANAVWIISGRDQEFLHTHLGDIANLGFSAEHGAYVRQPRTGHLPVEKQWEDLTLRMNMDPWRKDVTEIFDYYTARTQGSHVERKKCALTWHYRNADPEYGAFQARECQAHLESTVSQKYDVEVMTGKANLEVRPTFINKGEIARRLVDEYPEGEKPEFIYCLGDDATDEDMFRSLRKTGLPAETIFACTVGPSTKKTLATWHLLEASDVINTVAMLIGQDQETVGGEYVDSSVNGGGVPTTPGADEGVVDQVVNGVKAAVGVGKL